MEKRYRSVWDDLIDDSEGIAGLNRCSDYLLLIQARLHGQSGTDEERAKHFGLPVEQVLDLMAGKIDRFDLPQLIAIARKTGITTKL